MLQNFDAFGPGGVVPDVYGYGLCDSVGLGDGGVHVGLIDAVRTKR